MGRGIRPLVETADLIGPGELSLRQDVLRRNQGDCPESSIAWGAFLNKIDR
jgi:hypothetical protein